MLVLSLAQASLAAPLGCAAASDAAGLDAVLGRAEAAIADLDPDGLSSAVREATEAVCCLGAPAEPALLARFFRARGVAAFAGHDDGRARAAFAAARALEPGLRLDPVLQGPIAELFAADVDGSTAALAPAPSGAFYVDAEPSVDVPVRRTSLVQWVDGGEVRQSWIVEPGDPLPVLAIAPAPEPLPAPVAVPAPVPAGPRSSRALLAGALAAGVVGGLAAGGAALAEHAFLASEQPPDEVRDTLAVNRVLSVASYGLFAGAAGLGVGAVVVGRW